MYTKGISHTRSSPPVPKLKAAVRNAPPLAKKAATPEKKAADDEAELIDVDTDSGKTLALGETASAKADGDELEGLAISAADVALFDAALETVPKGAGDEDLMDGIAKELAAAVAASVAWMPILLTLITHRCILETTEERSALPKQ